MKSVDGCVAPAPRMFPACNCLRSPQPCITCKSRLQVSLFLSFFSLHRAFRKSSPSAHLLHSRSPSLFSSFFFFFFRLPSSHWLPSLTPARPHLDFHRIQRTSSLRPSLISETSKTLLVTAVLHPRRYVPSSVIFYWHCRPWFRNQHWWYLLSRPAF